MFTVKPNYKNTATIFSKKIQLNKEKNNSNSINNMKIKDFLESNDKN